jgi:hypothetical protein
MTVRPIPPPVLVRAFLGMFFSYYITGYPARPGHAAGTAA